MKGFSRSIRSSWVLIAAVMVAASIAHAQPVITGITINSLTPTPTPVPGGSRKATSYAGTNSNNGVFITKGTTPTTDPFLYTASFPAPTGPLIPGGITLATGLNTFYLWTAGGVVASSTEPNFAVSLFTGVETATSTPTLSSYFGGSFTTNTGLGATVINDFGANVAGSALSAMLGNYQVTITDWSPAVVTSDRFVGSYFVVTVPPPVTSAVGRLVLTVVDRTPGTNVVPEPSTGVLVLSGLAVLGIVARRRRQA